MDANTVIGVSAAIIALSALFVAVWQGVQIRKHNRLSTRPLLVFFNALEHTCSLPVLNLTNNGLGPAIIKESKIYLDNNSVGPLNEESWVSIGDKVDLFRKGFYAMGIYKNEPILPADSLNLIWIEAEKFNKEDWEHLISSMNRIKIFMKYESIYGEQFAIQWDGSDHFA
jgi:hypothetical protein